MPRHRKLTVDGHRVLQLRRHPELSVYACRMSVVPVGLEFRPAGNGWAVIGLVPWELVPRSMRAGEVLDEADGIDRVPVGSARVAAGEDPDPVEGDPVLAGELS